MKLCVLGSGSEGNATLVYTDTTALLVDVGFVARTMEKRFDAIGFDPSRLDAFLITHEHSDHMRGAEILSKKYSIPVYMTAGTANNVSARFKRCGRIKTFRPEVNFSVGDIEVNPFPIPHDVAEPVGFLLESNGRSAVNVTDIGCVTTRVVEKLRRANLAVVEANHNPAMLANGPYPAFLKRRIAGNEGHLSNEQCAELLGHAMGNGLSSVIFAHISRTNNQPEHVEEIARGIFAGTDVKYELASQDIPGTVFEV